MSTELAIISYPDVEKMAIAVAKSQLFGAKTTEQALVLLLLAQAEGLHPMIAARDYDIIQNKPAKKSEAMMRSFQQAGGSVEWIELSDTIAKAKFIPPTGSPLVVDWTIERAKKAGLLEKNGGMYIKYPRRMLSARCISEGIKTVWPSATSGMLSTEEALDITPEVEVKKVTGKSRVEAMIDNQVEDAQVTPVKEEVKYETNKEVKEPIKDKSKEQKVKKDDKHKETKESSESKTRSTTTDSSMPDGNFKIKGIIEGQPRSGVVDGKTKYLFKIQDKEYGTFDEVIVKEIMKVVDLQQDKPPGILVEFTYKERESTKTPGKMFQDIVSFKQVTINDPEVQDELPI